MSFPGGVLVVLRSAGLQPSWGRPPLTPLEPVRDRSNSIILDRANNEIEAAAA